MGSRLIGKTSDFKDPSRPLPTSTVLPALFKHKTPNKTSYTTTDFIYDKTYAFKVKNFFFFFN